MWALQSFHSTWCQLTVILKLSILAQISPQHQTSHAVQFRLILKLVLLVLHSILKTTRILRMIHENTASQLQALTLLMSLTHLQRALPHKFASLQLTPVTHQLQSQLQFQLLQTSLTQFQTLQRLHMCIIISLLAPTTVNSGQCTRIRSSQMIIMQKRLPSLSLKQRRNLSSTMLLISHQSRLPLKLKQLRLMLWVTLSMAKTRLRPLKMTGF